MSSNVINFMEHKWNVNLLIEDLTVLVAAVVAVAAVVSVAGFVAGYIYSLSASEIAAVAVVLAVRKR